MRPPFRADHVGSLLRPPELKAARERGLTVLHRGDLLAEMTRLKDCVAVSGTCLMATRIFMRSAPVQTKVPG